MSRPKNSHRPWWAPDPHDRFANKLWRELQTRGSREGQALVFDGFDLVGRVTYKRVPHRYPLRGVFKFSI